MKRIQKNQRRVFLSHSHTDNSFAEKLAHDLESAGIQCWLDLWEMRVGDSLRNRVEMAVRKSDWLAVVLSQHSVQSEWVKHELNMAFVRELDKKGVFVLPIVIDGCKMPLTLRDKFFADFRFDYDYGFDRLAEKLLDISPEQQAARRRLKRHCLDCDKLMPMLMGFLTGGMRAGHALATVLEFSAREIPDPMSQELKQVLQDLAQGQAMVSALRGLVRRVPTYRMHFLVGALVMQGEFGAAMTHCVDVYTLLRIDEGKLIDKVRTAH